METDTEIPARAPLYVMDAEIGRRLGINEKDWPRVRCQFELEGMPKADAVTRKRFWPAVYQWLLARHNIGVTVKETPYGKENWT
jgi:hypothetical protein